VLTLGFLMLASLVVSAGLSALGNWVNTLFPGAQAVMMIANIVISIVLLSAVFAAIFKLLPDTPIAWRDVAIGAVVTAVLFTIGKTLIGLYIGTTHVASGFGAAGSLIVMLVWIYYSSLIFLLGAEFTRAYAEQHGSHVKSAEPALAAQSPQREGEPEPTTSAALPSAVLLADIEMTRGNIDETWRQIRARIPTRPCRTRRAAAHHGFRSRWPASLS
jgi:membrane protein